MAQVLRTLSTHRSRCLLQSAFKKGETKEADLHKTDNEQSSSQNRVGIAVTRMSKTNFLA
eukprot:3581422-Amphidinium_carterae.1